MKKSKLFNILAVIAVCILALMPFRISASAADTAVTPAGTYAGPVSFP